MSDHEGHGHKAVLYKSHFPPLRHQLLERHHCIHRLINHIYYWRTKHHCYSLPHDKHGHLQKHRNGNIQTFIYSGLISYQCNHTYVGWFNCVEHNMMENSGICCLMSYFLSELSRTWGMICNCVEHNMVENSVFVDLRPIFHQSHHAHETWFIRNCVEHNMVEMYSNICWLMSYFLSELSRHMCSMDSVTYVLFLISYTFTARLMCHPSQTDYILFEQYRINIDIFGSKSSLGF